MDYVLAKEMKDAGFPQHSMPKRTKFANHDEPVYLPTLEELIETCGTQFGLLERYKPTSWRAFNPSENIYGIAGTPEEAVARLWLALNK